MKCKTYIALALIALSAMFLCSETKAQQQQGQDVYQRAEEEADRLAELLGLDDWQTFYVDSTLKHDLPAIMEEFNKLNESRVSNADLYQTVQDKWFDQIDATYKKIFTEEQWAAYLKTSGGKAYKAREKRKAKAANSKK
jgi:hypothetical protein